MTVRGWVYVMVNHSMPGLVKVGYSTKTGIKAKELAGTGVPTRLDVCYDALVIEPYNIEQKVHAKLKDHNAGKEWFRCDVRDAIDAIKQIASDDLLSERFVHESLRLPLDVVEVSGGPGTRKITVRCKWCRTEFAAIVSPSDAVVPCAKCLMTTKIDRFRAQA